MTQQQIHPDTALLTLIGDLQIERLQLRELVAQQQRVIAGLQAQIAALPEAAAPDSLMERIRAALPPRTVRLGDFGAAGCASELLWRIVDGEAPTLEQVDTLLSDERQCLNGGVDLIALLREWREQA